MTQGQGFHDPPRWSEDELRAFRTAAVDEFIRQRIEEGPKEFVAACRSAEDAVRSLLASTNDLTEFQGRLLVEQPDLIEVARYVCAPPISQEDIWTIAGGKLSLVRPDQEVAESTVRALLAAIDPKRFAWVIDDRRPSDHERGLAIAATSAMFALEALRTQRRLRSSVEQERQVGAALETAGFEHRVVGASLSVLDELPRGSFTRETKVAGAKCDVPLRLHDGRLLAIECKVSNGPKNGWKRLHREAGGKATSWRSAFGGQVVPAAVLAGVYDLSCLSKAQDDYRLALFWQHDLGSLVDFATRAI